MKRLIIFLFVLNSLLFSQWEEVKLYPFKGDILSFFMKDSLNVIAAVNSQPSLIVKSSNGGKDWQIVHTIINRSISEAIFTDENNIIAASFYSPVQVVKSTDGGETWSIINIPSRFSSMDDIQFFDVNLGFALVDDSQTAGEGKRLIKTIDGGLNWSVLDSSFGNAQSFRFINPQLGWVFNNQIYKTTDGGTTFSIFPKPANMDAIRSIDIVADSVIVIGGFTVISIPPYSSYPVPQVAISTNGGQTWKFKDFTGSGVGGKVTEILFMDENTAVGSLIEGNGVVYSKDRGNTWGYGTWPVNSFSLRDIQINGGRVYGSGLRGSFLVSNPDPAQPWELLSDYSTANIRNTYFHDRGFVILSAENQKIHISSDKGNSWVTRRLMNGVPYAICLASDSTIYAATYKVLYRSMDMGMSFDSIASTPDLLPKYLEVWPNNDIWLTLSNRLLYSSNNGVTWETRSPLASIRSKPDIFSDGTGYLCNGSMYKTTDYGITWNLLLSSGVIYANADFFDKMNGIVLGPEGLILRTRDGGLTFDQLVIPGSGSVSSVFYFDSLNIYINASSLYSTYDGGWSWKINEFQPPNFSPQFSWLNMYDNFDGLGVSISNGIWKTHNRGNTPVELSLFSALPFGNKVVLQWTTETETNNMGFEIERKYRNGEWKKIAFSKGSGTSTRKIFYGYDDYEPKAPALLYYRLKQIDYNGEFEYSNEVEVIYGEVPENYSIQQNYPNPFNPSTKVTFALPEENKVVIRVFNAMGEQVREIDRGILSHGYFEQDFEMGTESSGMYFCQVLCTNTISGRTKSLTVKMVLMK